MQHVARLSKALSIRLRSQLRWGVPWQGSGVTVCPTHTQVTMGTSGSLPPSKSVHSERGTPPQQGEDKDGQYN